MLSERTSPYKFDMGLREVTPRFLAVVSFSAILLLNLNGLCSQAEPVRSEGGAEAKERLGPRSNDLNSRGYKILKVVRMERTLNALGIAGQFGKTNKVGKYVELPKRLEPSEAGECFLITWKRSRRASSARPRLENAGKPDETDVSRPEALSAPPKMRAEFEYRLSNEEEIQSLTREYPNPKAGRYRLRFDNLGGDYRRKGRVEYWRFRVFDDGELVARKESFLWPIFQGKREGSP